jgi:hypothetical protein
VRRELLDSISAQNSREKNNEKNEKILCDIFDLLAVNFVVAFRKRQIDVRQDN